MGRLNRSAPEDAEVRFKSSGQTNARDITPNLKEDVVRGTKQDIERIGKGMNSNAASEWNRSQQQNAAGRALTRTLGRAGAASAALQGGYEAGRALDEKTGIGKKMVEKSGLGDLAERMVNSRDKVELSKESKERIAKGDLEEKRGSTQKVSRTQETETEPSGKYHAGRNEDITEDSREAAGGYKKGGVVSASRRADGIAMRGKTRGKMC
jgi:hypothetical protein